MCSTVALTLNMYLHYVGCCITIYCREHMPSVTYLRLDGSVAPSQRQPIVHRYSLLNTLHLQHNSEWTHTVFHTKRICDILLHFSVINCPPTVACMIMIPLSLLIILYMASCPMTRPEYSAIWNISFYLCINLTAYCLLSTKSHWLAVVCILIFGNEANKLCRLVILSVSSKNC